MFPIGNWPKLTAIPNSFITSIINIILITKPSFPYESSGSVKLVIIIWEYLIINYK